MILTGKVDHGYLILCKPAKQSFPFPCRKREKRSRRAKARKKILVLLVRLVSFYLEGAALI